MSHGAGGGAGIAVLLFTLLWFVFVFAMILFTMLLVLGFTVVWIYAAYWVYRDADRRGVDSPALWGLVVFAVGPLGLLVYLLAREQ